MSAFDFSRVITTGGSGMIGSYIDFGVRPDIHELDILDEKRVMEYVQEHAPVAIIHLAGATNMKRCETEPAHAYELNVRGTHNVARAARAVGAMMVYVSTSRVFRGDKVEPYGEADVPDPETHYGRTKYLGELITAAFVPNHIIARTAWVFGGGRERDNKFHGKVIEQLQNNNEVSALTDVVGSPTYGKDLVFTIRSLLEKGELGIVHIANGGMATRYDIASHMAITLGSKSDVRGVDRSHFDTGSTLPANESIVSERLTLRPWKEALTEYLTMEWRT